MAIAEHPEEFSLTGYEGLFFENPERARLQFEYLARIEAAGHFNEPPVPVTPDSMADDTIENLVQAATSDHPAIARAVFVLGDALHQNAHEAFSDRLGLESLRDPLGGTALLPVTALGKHLVLRRTTNVGDDGIDSVIYRVTSPTWDPDE